MPDNCHTLHRSQGLTDMHDDLFEVVDSPVPLASDAEEGAERGVGQQQVVADGGLAQLQVIHRSHQLWLCCRHAAGDNSDMDGCMCGSRSGQTHKHVINMRFHACAHKLGQACMCVFSNTHTHTPHTHTHTYTHTHTHTHTHFITEEVTQEHKMHFHLMKISLQKSYKHQTIPVPTDVTSQKHIAFISTKQQTAMKFQSCWSLKQTQACKAVFLYKQKSSSLWSYW